MNYNYNMYKEIQTTADVNTSSKKQLVLMMYDAVVNNLHDAINAIKYNNIAIKLEKIKKTLAIIELGLIMSLSKNGAKEVAESLELFYEDAASGIVFANATNNVKVLKDIQKSFSDLRKCWELVKE